jgi:hypothetical protein
MESTYTIGDLKLADLRRRNAELQELVDIHDRSSAIQELSRELVEVKRERDELAASLRHHGHLQMCPRFTSGFSQNPCDCGVENAKAILAAHDAALVKPLVEGLTSISDFCCSNEAVRIANAAIAAYRKVKKKP